jgi:hypothetical protein
MDSVDEGGEEGEGLRGERALTSEDKGNKATPSCCCGGSMLRGFGWLGIGKHGLSHSGWRDGGGGAEVDLLKIEDGVIDANVGDLARVRMEVEEMRGMRDNGMRGRGAVDQNFLLSIVRAKGIPKGTSHEMKALRVDHGATLRKTGKGKRERKRTTKNHGEDCGEVTWVEKKVRWGRDGVKTG